MIQVLIGKKIEQTQKFTSDGRRLPITEIAVPDNAVTQVKTEDKDKYNAVQIGIGKKKKPSKPALGHVKKAGFDSVHSSVREVRLDMKERDDMLKAGDYIKVEDVFKAGDTVDIAGTSKGKGFAGVMKRHNFRGGPKTHGQSDRARAPGSIGQTTTPGRVYLGKRMAGRMGHELVTVKNLKVVEVDSEKKRILVAGLVPGVINSVVYITRTGTDKKFVSLHTSADAKEPVKEEVVTEAVSEEQAVQATADEKKAEVKAEQVKAEEKQPEEKNEAESKKDEGGK